MKIFVSSTYEDLKDERSETVTLIDRDPIGKAIAMEKFFASNHKSKDVCLKRLQECDAMVLILGFRYGSIDKTEGVSFTEIEYNTAKTLGLPIFVFQKRKPDGSWRTEETDKERTEKLFAFKSRLDEERYRVTFVTPQELAKEIIGAIRQYEIENGAIGSRLPAFTSCEDFFKPFIDNSKLFNHVYPLVGRKEFLDYLDIFVESDKRIALLFGRGGIGKSKILFEFSREFKIKHSEWKLRYLREGIKLSEDSIRQLPTQKCIIVVDDAHRRDDLSTLFTMAQQYPERIKMVLTFRPQGIDYIRATLTKGGFDPNEVENIPEIKDLDISDLEELGKAVLGKNHQHFLDSLIRVAKDSPLAFVIGGRLIAEDLVDPTMLERHDEFHRVVFDRFLDVLYGQISDKLDKELCRNILSLISAISPIQPQTERFQETASKFLDIDRIKLIDAISILEKAGVLLRRGYSLRITPDILSDHIIYNACITLQGQLTGYAKKIFDAFAEIFPENILFNLSELDWRISREGKSIDLLCEIWGTIENNFKKASHLQRTMILQNLKSVAYFQPARTLYLIEYTIKNPSKISGNDEWASIYQYTNKDVLHALPTLLERIALNLDYLPRCCDLLWLLGREEKISTTLEPAISVLTNLARYEVDKPVDVNSIVLDAVERWLKEPDAHAHKQSLLDLLDPLLAKEGDTARIRGHNIVSIPFVINFEKTKRIRKKAISLLSDCVQSPSTKLVLRALKSLINSLNPPHGLFGRTVSESEINQWLPEQIEILEIIENLIKNTRDPIILIQITSDLQWHIKLNHQRIVTEKADSIIKAIPQSFDLRITRAIWNRYDRDWNGEDYDKHQERVKNEVKQVVIEFLEQYNDGKKIFDFLNKLLSQFQNCGIQAQPGYFLYLLATNNCKLSIEVCEHMISQPSSPLSIYLNSLLSGIRENSSTKAIALIKLAIETKDSILYSSIAQGYARDGWASTIEFQEIVVIETLLKHPDKPVKHRIIAALGRFPDDKKDMAIRLAFSTAIEDDEELANTLCGIFDSKYGISPEQLKTEDLEAMLSKLAGIKKLENNLYNLDRFLGYCSSRIPEAVIEFFLKRLDIAEENKMISGDKYQPLPYGDFHYGLKEISSSPNYIDLLRKVRERALDPTSTDYFWIPKLFADISSDFSLTCIGVLDEWVNSGDIKKIQAVGLLVEGMPSEIIFSHADFISRLLERSFTTSIDCSRSVENNLILLAFSGGKSGVAGQPMPQDEKIRNLSKDLSGKFPQGSVTQRFYIELARRAEASIRDCLARDEEIFEE